MILEISALLDENWLSAILGIVFSLFIFLLGVPTVFFQTFLPEDIRHIYNKRIGKNEKKTIIFLCFIVIILTITVNHGIKFFLKEKLDNSTNNPAEQEYIKSCIKFYYAYVLIIFIAFLVFINRIFLRFIFVKENIRKKIVSKIIKDAKKNYLDNERIVPEDILDLKTLGKTSPQGVNKSYILDGIKDLLLFVLDINQVPVKPSRNIFRFLHKTRAVCKYDGEKLLAVIDTVLFETICKNVDDISEKNLRQAIEICRIIRQTQETCNSLIDARALSTLLTRISIICIERNYYDLARESMELIFKLPNDETNFYDINLKAFQKGKLVFISTAVAKIHNNFLRDPDKKEKINYDAMLHNMIAYLSWLFSFNNQSQSFARSFIKKAVHTNILNEAAIEKSRIHFYSVGDYYTAQAIYNLLSSMNNKKGIYSRIFYFAGKFLRVFDQQI